MQPAISGRLLLNSPLVRAGDPVAHLRAGADEWYVILFWPYSSSSETKRPHSSDPVLDSKQKPFSTTLLCVLEQLCPGSSLLLQALIHQQVENPSECVLPACITI
mmetsp:Transcript_40282/g.106706  ORF Transcript_40282/g.106706 Transcript_40282/m.106706 type:complete len:105 (+) Transcript_40282:1907-2221(+)